MDELLEELMEKYWWTSSAWTPIEQWDAKDLVDLEIMVNGELQRREHDRQH